MGKLQPFQETALYKSLYGGLRKGIEVAFNERCFGAGVILLMSGIDTLGHLSRAAGKLEGDSEDFKSWVKKYLNVPGKTMITPEEWWAARCATVHTFGSIARNHRNVEGVRILLWKVSGKPYNQYDTKNPEYVLVDLIGMKEVFFEGLDRFIIDSFTYKEKGDLIEQRAQDLLVEYPYPEEGDIQ